MKNPIGDPEPYEVGFNRKMEEWKERRKTYNFDCFRFTTREEVIRTSSASRHASLVAMTKLMETHNLNRVDNADYAREWERRMIKEVGNVARMSIVFNEALNNY